MSTGTLGRFKPYPKYKDSGVEWLGEVPAHWEVKRTKFAARLRSGHTPSRQHPEYWENCTIPWFGLADVWQIRDGHVEKVTDTAERISPLGLANSSARLLPKGTVMLSRTASVGFSAIMGVDMATTQDFANWVCLPGLQPEYLLYVLRSMAHDFQLLIMGSTHQTIYMPDIGRFSTVVPPIEEQNRIVAFIRTHAKQVDALVAKQERLIELLQEKRSAAITQAVTKGLDPNVPMKDSGVECMGKIPERWSVRKLKHVSRRVTKGTTPTTMGREFATAGVRFVKVESLSPRFEIALDVCTFIDAETDMLLARSRLHENDVLVGIAGAIGRVAVVDARVIPANANQAVAIARLRLNDVVPRWVAYCLTSDVAQEQFGLTQVQSAQANLSLSDLANTWLPVAPLDEQRRIARELDQAVQRFEKLRMRVGVAIDRLNELRTALISAAVTGKIDVRDEADRTSAAPVPA